MWIILHVIKCVHFHNCPEVFFVLVLEKIWHWVQCSSVGNILGICGNSWLCVCISSTGDHCTHALIHRRAQDRRQLCSVWEPGQRVYPAFPLRCQSRQPSFDSLTFQFYPPALSPRFWTLRLLSLSPSLSPFSPQVSLTHPRIFCLSWRAIPEPSINAFCYLAEDGIEFDAPTHSLRYFLCTPIRSACRPVAGRSSALQHGVPNLYHCLLLLHSICSSMSFMPPPPHTHFHFLSSCICHCFSDISSIYFPLACSQSLTYTHPPILFHSLSFCCIVLALCLCLC